MTLVQFQKDSAFPFLESALLNLLKREERLWGYFQVKQQHNDYFLCIPGLPKLRIAKNEKKFIYRAYWIDKKEASISVRYREKMVLDAKSKREKEQKHYDILRYFDPRENQQQHLINGLLAELIKGEIENNLPPVGEKVLQPIVTIVKRDRPSV